MSDKVKDDERRGENCVFYCACKGREEVDGKGKRPGWCKPWKINCELDEGRVCGMFLKK